MLRRPLEESLHVIGTRFAVVEFGKGAGVDKVNLQLPLPARLDDRIGKGSIDRRKGVTHLFERNVVVFGSRPLFTGEIYGGVGANRRFIYDGYDQASVIG